MAAKLNNSPAYVVYDKSYFYNIDLWAEWTLQPAGTYTEQTGTFNLISDKNLTTGLKWFQYTEVNGGTPGQPHVAITVDYLKVLWNVSTNYNVDFVYATPRAISWYIQASIDNVNWVNIDSGGTVGGIGSVSKASNYSTMRARYIKFGVYANNRENGSQWVYCTLNELRIMGSD